MMILSGPIQHVDQVKDSIKITVGNQATFVTSKHLGKAVFESVKGKLKKNVWVELKCESETKDGETNWVAKTMTVDTKFKINEEPV